MNLDAIYTILHQKCCLSKESSILVGVSGGPDSLCLLSVLKECGYAVYAAHVNHHLRPEADSEAERVHRYCSDWSIPYSQFDVDVLSYMDEQQLSIEEAARILRYRCLMKAADEISAQALAVAHQADDQVETMLMHLLRGSGMSGLKGMSFRSYNTAFSSEIPIVRPLLGVWRWEIEQYCEEHNITPCYDESNNDRTYFRNRIRHDLIPELKTYNIQADQHLWQLSQLLGDEDRLLQALSQEGLEKVISRRGTGYFVIKRSSFSQLDTAIQRRVIRQVLAALRENLRDIGLEPVEKVNHFLMSSSSKGDSQILEGVNITRTNPREDLIYTETADLSEIWPLVLEGQEFLLPIGKELVINKHWKVKTTLEKTASFEIDQDQSFAYFDADLLEDQISLSVWEMGEAFSPFGMGGQKIKVGDYFTNIHLPELARARWPILRMQKQILWIAGLRRSNTAPVTLKTRRILKIHLILTD
jgi:tRNA(Ile)-lysidine synthase